MRELNHGSKHYCHHFPHSPEHIIHGCKNSNLLHYIREFGIRKNKKKTWKKLVISPVFCIFIVENQNITKSTGDDYQRQSYRDFLYYR